MACYASLSPSSSQGSRRLVLAPLWTAEGHSSTNMPWDLREEVQPWKKVRCRLPLRATWQPQDTSTRSTLLGPPTYSTLCGLLCSSLGASSVEMVLVGQLGPHAVHRWEKQQSSRRGE